MLDEEPLWKLIHCSHKHLLEWYIHNAEFLKLVEEYVNSIWVKFRSIGDYMICYFSSDIYDKVKE
jgi:hypothetical protein